MPANPVRQSIAETLAKNSDELSQLRLPAVVVELLQAADKEIERLELTIEDMSLDTVSSFYNVGVTTEATRGDT